MAGCRKILSDWYRCGDVFMGSVRLCDKCKREELEEENLKLENEKLRLEIEKLKGKLKQKERK